MNRCRHFRGLAGLLCLLISCHVLGHVGSPNVFFEGEAGPNSIRVVIQTPPVVPGLARISVRVRSPGPHEVEVLPVKWDAGRKGAPPPDSAQLVRGETNLYSAQLWLMTTGSHGVVVRVSSPLGKGEAAVPVDAIATRKLAMTSTMTVVLCALGLLLLALAVSIARAGLNESLLEPGTTPSRRRVWLGRGAGLASLAIMAAALVGGWKWWGVVDRDFLQNRLYRPPDIDLTLSERDQVRALRLAINDPRWEMHQRTALIPDHGKLMHLFLAREPGLDVFAHLHPAGREDRLFDTALPDLPEGNYRVFADVTHETGFNQTLLSRIHIGPGAKPAPWHHAAMRLDATDSWHVSTPLLNSGHAPTFSPPNARGYRVEWDELREVRVQQDVSLRFRATDASGKPAPIELYMGMPGHAVVLHEDGSVFTHLHPQGTASMAALLAFAKRELDINAVRRLDDLICGLDRATSATSFPYAFPKPGRYRIWAQFKVEGEILTGAFELVVLPAAS